MSENEIKIKYVPNLTLLHRTWNTVAWCLYLKKSGYRPITNTVHSRYISGERNKFRENFKASWRWNSTISLCGPSKTDYFCVIYKRKIYLFYSWTRSYLVMIYLWSTVLYSRSCYFFRTAEVILKFCQNLGRWICT